LGNTRRYDAIVNDAITIGGIPKKRYYEFKSYSNVPPTDFEKQFVNDLNNPDISDLSQLQWYFDAAKNPPNFETNMKAAINSLDKTKITNATIAKFKVANADELLDKIENNFSNIFYLK
jgi:hypothetical protein